MFTWLQPCEASLSLPSPRCKSILQALILSCRVIHDLPIRDIASPVTPLLHQAYLEDRDEPLVVALVETYCYYSMVRRRGWINCGFRILVGEVSSDMVIIKQVSNCPWKFFIRGKAREQRKQHFEVSSRSWSNTWSCLHHHHCPFDPNMTSFAVGSRFTNRFSQGYRRRSW